MQFVTLDGVYQGPGSPDEDTTGDFTRGGWMVPHMDQTFMQIAAGWLQRADALLLGRRTYEAFSLAWPTMTDPDDPFASRMNSLQVRRVAHPSRDTVDAGDNSRRRRGRRGQRSQGGAGSRASTPRIRNTRPALAGDDRVAVVTLTGEGSSFCAGLDRHEMQSDDQTTREGIFEASRDFHRAVVGFPKPLIAGIDGHTLGTGFDLAVLCDVRIATTRASFGHPEILLGGVPLFTPLKLVVGDGWARRLCLDATPIDASTAERIGLVVEVVEPAELTKRAGEIARSIARAPSGVLRETKALFGAHPDPEAWLVTDHDEVFEAGQTIRRHDEVR